MIESITIANYATYTTPETLTGLSRFNYLFGSNGTGKTTISRVIADPTGYPGCSVTWRGGTKLQSMVYNSDFVKRNFDQPTEWKGVFTLGEKQVDTAEKIKKAKEKREALESTIEKLRLELQGADGAGGKKGDLAKLDENLTEQTWKLKLNFDGKLAQSALKGYMGSKASFKVKVLQELASNTVSFVPLQDLEKKAKSVFVQTPTNEALIEVPDTSRLLTHEENSILKKRVIGKDDVDIAAMIKKLGNSDWVRAGRSFYDENDGVCPFCQQSTTEVFSRSLGEYFDETFVTDSKAIDDLVTNYETDAARLQQQLSSLIALPSTFLDIAKLKTEKELLDTKITLNNQRLAGKKKEASQVVELESLKNVLTSINALLEAANAQVEVHNKMVANLTVERAKLISQVWRYVLEELKPDLAVYETKKGPLDKDIATMITKIEAAKTEMAKKVDEIRELEKQTTSVQPTIDEINRLLTSFGFQSFKLARAGTGTSYRLLRPDGSDARVTLSEGERSFVTFLYFYHLLKGSESDSGITTDRIVVFDDPVSSLDSDILFIVSSLIKGLFKEVTSTTGPIKQIFVLTHNVYFHREVSFNKGQKPKDQTFWIVRKPGAVSKIEKYTTNPIKTSYELLWAEVKKRDCSCLVLQNTMRRILEYYFVTLGGDTWNELCAKFEEKDKIICNSLISWLHDGSHNVYDDLCISIGDSMVESYRRVFKEIFDKSHHSAHYQMMMGDDVVEERAISATG